MEDSPQLRAVAGIAYYMSPRHTVKEAILDPIHTAVYIMFTLSACALFSRRGSKFQAQVRETSQNNSKTNKWYVISYLLFSYC
jgi:preprotein translocase subunit SecY